VTAEYIAQYDIIRFVITAISLCRRRHYYARHSTRRAKNLSITRDFYPREQRLSLNTMTNNVSFHRLAERFEPWSSPSRSSIIPFLLSSLYCDIMHYLRRSVFLATSTTRVRGPIQMICVRRGHFD